MQVTPVKQFVADNAVTAISQVRTNENGYPFLTLLSAKFEGGAQNIYFSKTCALKVKLGQNPKELGLADYNVVEATNAAGETRLKLTNNTDYVKVDDLF
jgi:hypothetical protein